MEVRRKVGGNGQGAFDEALGLDMSSSEGMSVLELVSAGIEARNWGCITLSKLCFCILFIFSTIFKAFASLSGLISSTPGACHRR